MGQRIPAKFGKCVVEKQLAQGATALVFLACHEGLGIEVAVKVLRRRLSESRPEYAERFLREARMAARLEHPNLVRVIDCGIESGYHYMVMDYVSGRNCMQMIRKRRDALPWRDATEVVRQAALGLSYAADKGIIHRDVKPSNIMIDQTGRVRVTDLGLAKLTVKGVAELTQELHTVGTPNYMSPEQIRCPARLDHRADIYSLGATYYHLVTGRPPFVGDNPMDVVSRHLTEPLTPPYKLNRDLPAAVSQVIAKMMAKSAEKRYQKYEALCDDLQNLLEGKKVSARSFEETYQATAQDKELLDLLQQLSVGTALDEDEEGAAEEAVEVAGDEKEAGSSSALVAPFDESDLVPYSPPAEEDSTILRRRPFGQDRAVFLVVVLVIFGVIGVLAVALYAILSAR
ncbi:MAG: serine/threonine-protein kinase [Candidatus Brocadiaceae bacterium]